MNSNIRCIEIFDSETFTTTKGVLNSNIRCIEMGELTDKEIAEAVE